MKKKVIAIIIVAVIVVVILIRLIPGEKDRVKRDIMSLKNAIEKENKISAIGYIDTSYYDNSIANYEGLSNAIDNFFAEFDSLEIFMSGLKIWIDSTDNTNTIFARCSLGIKVLATYKGEKVLVYGGFFMPEPARASLKKSGEIYKIYAAEY